MNITGLKKVLSLCALIVLCLIFTFREFTLSAGIFPLDDSYIHWQYAHNLARGEWFVFNSGEPSMGTSSQLFVLLAAGALRLGLDYYYFCILLGLVSLAGSAVLCALLAERLLAQGVPELGAGCRSAFALTAGLLVVTNGNLLWQSLSGLETAFYVFFQLLAFYLYAICGWGLLTGIVIGLTICTRINGVVLAGLLFVFDINRGRRNLRGWAVSALCFLAVALNSLVVGGSILPANVAAKALTYVNADFNLAGAAAFWAAAIEFMGLTPGVTLGFFAVLIWLLVRIGEDLFKLNAAAIPEDVFELAAWGLLELGVIGVFFRSPLHHMRYVVVIYPIMAVLSAYALGSMARRRRLLGGLLLAAGLLIGGNTWSVKEWSELYNNNVKQIAVVYMPAARWIMRNTAPQARIAAFDIGVLKRISGRYIVDLGGLVDAEIHHDLGERRVLKFLRQSKADYIVYSRDPDCDVFTGIYERRFSEAYYLRQTRQAVFQMPHYREPTITHSFRLDIYRINDWLKASAANARAAVRASRAEVRQMQVRLDHSFESGVTLLGYDLDNVPLERCRAMVQTLRLTLYWKVKGGQFRPFEFVTEVLNPHERMVWSQQGQPGGGILPPAQWGPDDIVKDEVDIRLPAAASAGRYAINLRLRTIMQELSVPQEKAYCIGFFQLKISPIWPVKL